MKELFGTLPDGSRAFLYTVTNGKLTAVISDLGATLVKLFVPDHTGKTADVVLGFDDPCDYIASGTFFGATVGRNANRIKNAVFTLNDRLCEMTPNEASNNLHSGPDYFKDRLWTVEHQDVSSIRFRLNSPDGDQGFPGNARIHVTYSLEADNSLRIAYDAVSDKDTIFNFTNHSYFNLAGHDLPEKALSQQLTLRSHFYLPTDTQNVPTGEKCPVDGTPMDFRTPKAIGADIHCTANGYDHNYEVCSSPFAILADPASGRTMAVSTDCPGVQFYSGNFLAGEIGKDGICYSNRSGICLETQFWPDSVNHPQWKQPFTPAGELYHSETKYTFSW